MALRKKLIGLSAGFLLALGYGTMAPVVASAAHSPISLSERVMFADQAAKRAVPGAHPTAVTRARLNGIPVWKVTMERGGKFWLVVVNGQTYSVMNTTKI